MGCTIYLLSLPGRIIHVNIFIYLNGRIAAEARLVIPEKEVKLLPPVSYMDKLLCIGLNYSGHCKEQNKELPKMPVVFNKFSTSLIGAYDDIVIPELVMVSEIHLLLSN